MTPCSEIRSRIDIWLDGELAAFDCDLVANHIQTCPKCAEIVRARKNLRTRMQSAMASSPGADPRVRSLVDPRISRTKYDGRRWYFLAAAAVVLVAVAVYGTWRGPGEVMEVGLRQHIHCAINRTYPANGPSLAEMEEHLGSGYAALIPVVQENIPSGYSVVMAHKCHLKGRQFVHVIARDGGNLISLLITQRDTGESFERDLRAVASEAHADLYSAKADKLSVAGFETPNYLVYLVSAMDEGKNLHVFQAMTPAVKAALGAAGQAAL